MSFYSKGVFTLKEYESYALEGNTEIKKSWNFKNNVIKDPYSCVQIKKKKMFRRSPSKMAKVKTATVG